MISPVTLHRWAYAALFGVFASAVVFLRILPTGGSAGGWPPPDLVVLAGFAWVVHRPDFVPVLLFAALLLVSELLYLRPPGVASGLAVLGLEALRARAAGLGERSFLAEWFTVAVVLGLMLVAERLLLAVFFVGQPPFALSAIGFVINVAAYPAVAALSVWGFRVHRIAPGKHASEVRLV
ncbi:MAG: rod shape-determining protein MreD [Rhodobacterales bacterium]|nr:MAG: rod shape-determining protein MreD [Rhodobacterales bacterium]